MDFRKLITEKFQESIEEAKNSLAIDHDSYEDYVADRKEKRLQVLPKPLWQNLKNESLEENKFSSAISYDNYEDYKKDKEKSNRRVMSKKMWVNTKNDAIKKMNDLMSKNNPMRKKYGKPPHTPEPYVTENVQLDEDVHNDLSDLIFEFQKKIGRYKNKGSGIDPEVVRDLSKLDKMLDSVRKGKLHQVRPGR